MTSEEFEARLAEARAEEAQLVELERRWFEIGVSDDSPPGTETSLQRWVHRQREQLMPWETIARSLGVGVDAVKGRYLYRLQRSTRSPFSDLPPW